MPRLVTTKFLRRCEALEANSTTQPLRPSTPPPPTAPLPRHDPQRPTGRTTPDTEPAAAPRSPEERILLEAAPQSPEHGCGPAPCERPPPRRSLTAAPSPPRDASQRRYWPRRSGGAGLPLPWQPLLARGPAAEGSGAEGGGSARGAEPRGGRCCRQNGAAGARCARRAGGRALGIVLLFFH